MHNLFKDQYFVNFLILQVLKRRAFTIDVKLRGIDEKVENAKAKKVLVHFRGDVYKAEYIYGH